MTSISVSEARAELPRVLDAVARGDEVTLTRHGNPVAVLVRPDRLRLRRADDVFAETAELHEMLANARDRPLTRRVGLAPERAEELVAEIRADRSRH